MTTNSAAFFDVDGTLLSITSLRCFQEYYLKNSLTIPDTERESLRKSFIRLFTDYRHVGKNREYINREFYRTFYGRNKEEVLRQAYKWWNWELKNQSSLFVDSVVYELQKHQKSNRKTVLVSGSCYEILKPIAEHLNADDLLCTELDINEGVYTGEILGEQFIGEGKRTAINLYCKNHNLKSDQCFAYGDHISDLPMLESVGNPFVILGDQALETVANSRGWLRLQRNTQLNAKLI